MSQTITQHEIFQLVKKHGTCSITDLADQLDVSGETIRRNVKRLANQGLIVKFHGGITLPSYEPPIVKRMQHQVEEKKRIAEYVAEIVQEGDSLIIDTGSTTTFIAQALKNHSNLTVITNSSYIAYLLASSEGNRVFMLGGELRSHDAAAFGPSVIESVKSFQARKAILSIGAVHETKGCMNHQLCEAEFSKAVIQQAEQVILATDASKFGRTGLTKVCDLKEIDLLVCDEAPDSELRKSLETVDVTVKITH